MIISLEKKFIFVHNPKTAGSSIHDVLAPYDNLHLKARTKHETINQFAQRTKINPDDFFIFGFVRHPLDRFASFYHYLKGHHYRRYHALTEMRSVNDLAKCLDQPWLKRLHGYGPQYVFFNKNCYIGRFENLKRELFEIGETLGIPINIGHVNKSKNENWNGQYTDEGYELVRNHYKEDFERYGYV